MMTPLEYYRAKCESGAMSLDANQLKVMEDFQHLFHQLLAEHKKRNRYLSFIRRPKLVEGIYLWGGVGIGKTFLMDCFFHCIPISEKMRMHFHGFMQMVHEKLKQYQGAKNPLDIIAKEIAQSTMVLCFDEFFVSDITDAMLLGRLVKALFANGVTLVATSNTLPDDLYKRGLQRQQFLPAITLLKENTRVIHLPTLVDYRLKLLKDAGVYYTPNDDLADEKMRKLFDFLSEGHEQSADALTIQRREVPVVSKAGDIVWFDFCVLCAPPRSQMDYLELASEFHIIFLANIPVIAADENNKIALFIRLIDVLYDARVKLVFSSASTIDQIYTDGIFSGDFVRIRSRLIEMQSEEYFAS